MKWPKYVPSLLNECRRKYGLDGNVIIHNDLQRYGRLISLKYLPAICLSEARVCASLRETESLAVGRGGGRAFVDDVRSPSQVQRRFSFRG
jgi:hypothetical protein